jgi:hypothetical protein
MQLIEQGLVLAVAGFLVVDLAAVGLLRLLGAAPLVLALTAIGLPPALFVALWVVTALNERLGQ